MGKRIIFNNKAIIISISIKYIETIKAIHIPNMNALYLLMFKNTTYLQYYISIEKFFTYFSEAIVEINKINVSIEKERDK